MPALELIAGEYRVRTNLMNVSSYASLSTGKQLRQMDVSFQTFGPEDQVIQEIRDKYKIVETADGADSKRWGVREQSNSFTAGRPGVRYNWELHEIEELHLESLLLNDIEFTPEKYSESFDGKGVMTARGIVEVDDQQLERLQQLPLYFQVIRRGINDSPREMRFGQLLWSDKDDRTRVRLYLIDKEYDELYKNVGLMQPQTGNVATSVAATAVRFSRLMKLLLSKGLVSQAEEEEIRIVSRESLQRELWKHDEVDDLDDWLTRSGESDEDDD